MSACFYSLIHDQDFTLIWSHIRNCLYCLSISQICWIWQSACQKNLSKLLEFFWFHYISLFEALIFSRITTIWQFNQIKRTFSWLRLTSVILNCWRKVKAKDWSSSVSISHSVSSFSFCIHKLTSKSKISNFWDNSFFFTAIWTFLNFQHDWQFRWVRFMNCQSWKNLKCQAWC